MVRLCVELGGGEEARSLVLLRGGPGGVAKAVRGLTLLCVVLGDDAEARSLVLGSVLDGVAQAVRISVLLYVKLAGVNAVRAASEVEMSLAPSAIVSKARQRGTESPRALGC